MVAENVSRVSRQAAKLHAQLCPWQLHASSRSFATSTRQEALQQLHHKLHRPRLRFVPETCQHQGLWSGRRGAKKRTVVKVDELPQGAISVDPAERVMPDEVPEKISVVEQARNNMLKFPHCVLLTRVGGFYELYYEHAEVYGAMMNLKVAKRKSKDRSISMAGFPFYQLDRYLKILVQDLGKHVAISEEFPNDTSKRIKSGLLFDRKVARIITPGTLIDENFMDPFQSNYLLSIHVDAASAQPVDASDPPSILQAHQNADVGLAWIDLSSGDFFTEHIPLSSLPSAVARIGPREIILDEALESLETSPLVSLLKEDGHAITFSPRPESTDARDWAPMLEDVVEDFDASAFTATEVAAGGSLLHYVKKQLFGSGTRLQMPVRYRAQDFMSIDKHSIRALEIRSTLRDGNYEGSLLHAVKRTVTKSGTRLLTQRILAPSLSLPVINERLDLVSLFVDDEELRERLVALLLRTFDTPRLVQKFTFGRGDADDLVELSKTIQITADIAAALQSYCGTSDSGSDDVAPQYKSSLNSLVKRLYLDSPLSLAQQIMESIDEEGLSEQHRLEDSQAEEMAELAQDVVVSEGATDEEVKQLPKRVRPKNGAPRIITSSAISGTTQEPFIMRRTASPILETLHDRLDELAQQQEQLQDDLRSKLEADSLTLKWTPSLGHICHVKGRDIARLTKYSPARSVSTSKSTGSFHLPEWTHLGTSMDETRLRIRTEEQRVLSALRTQAVRNLVKLRRNAAVLDDLDVSCGFARLAAEHAWTRPILTTAPTHHILSGRHPVVEPALLATGRTFTPNDCTVGSPARLWLITGPNMAGKSTFLRQNALLCILAQAGSFVPAAHAALGLVDRLFSRVGAADDLARAQSTFLVEMAEAAAILRGATPRSFVIMDEVGRGTTPEDGVAVAFACLDHLLRVNRCRTIFATHFHRLADMTEGWDGVERYCSDVVEYGGVEGGKGVGEGGSSAGWVYVHKMRKGVNRESHALKVARLAGLPKEAIETAAKVLGQLKAEARSRDGGKQAV